MRSAPARRARRAPLAVVLGLALTACGANFQAQTYQERTVADGTNTAVGAIAVRNVHVLPPLDGTDVHAAGSDALVGFVLTNDGPEDDRLVEISSPAAASVELVQGDELVPIEGGLDLPRLSTTGVQVGAVLKGLTEDLRTGEFVQITMRFERNGAVDVQAPAATTGENDFDERERSEFFHPIGEGEGEGESAGTADESGEGGLGEAGEESTDTGDEG